MTDVSLPMDVVERMARAMVPLLSGSQEDAYGNDLPDVQFDDLTPDWQEAHRGYARAALEASGIVTALTHLSEALRELSFAAQTTGGTAGRDDVLVAAINEAESALTTYREVIGQ